ncbi:MAG: glutamyl-tRNA reductase [Candidatus Omnitrophota bacterium]
MEILVLGLNHKTAPVEVRERLCVPAKEAQGFLERFERQKVFSERVLLSTCNRTEIYGVVQDGYQGVQAAKQILSDYARLDLKAFESKLYVLGQPDSVRHLFAVAAGLDSLVVGETEITGQVKDAYYAAHGREQTGKVLNSLFQRSLKVAKSVRTHTGIGAGHVSVASVAVDLAEKIFENLQNARVMVIGTGVMAVQLLKGMTGRGAHPLVVSRHHAERSHELAAEFGAEAIPYETFEARMQEVDILLCSTTSTHCLIREPRVRTWMKDRHYKPLFVVDIAMPRNVEASIEKIDNVYLYNIDDLQGIAQKNTQMRQGQIELCSGLIQAQTQYFMNWLTKEFAHKITAAIH